MSVETPRQPLIKQGWLRAIILLVVYLSASIGAGFFVSTNEAWFAASFVIALLIVFFFRTVIDRKSFTSIGFEGDDFFKNALMGLCLGTFLVCTGTLLMYFMGVVEWIDITAGTSPLILSAGSLMMVAVGEELVFRGYILRNLMKSFNRWIALIVSAALFTIVHASNPDVEWVALINTFLGGLLTGITFMYTRSLWLPVFFHFSWNYIQGPVLGFDVSGIGFRTLLVLETNGNELMNGGNYGFEGSVICSALLALAIGTWTWKYYKSPTSTAT